MSGPRSLLIAVGALISGVALWIVTQSTDARAVADVVARAEPAPIAVILAVVGLQVLIRARRWSVLLPTPTPVPLARVLPPLLVGYLGNAILPARLGEPMRAIVVSRREPVGTTEALGTVIVERVLDVATLAVVAFGASLLADAPVWVVRSLGTAAVVGIGVVMLLATVGLTPVVRLAARLGLRRLPVGLDLAERLAGSIGSRPHLLVTAAAISVAAWILDAASFWLAGMAVGAEVSYPAAMLVSGVTVLGTALPSAPGYVGTFELAAVAMATTLGVPGETALAMAVIAHVMTLAPLAVGGAVSLVMMGARIGEIARAAETGQNG